MDIYVRVAAGIAHGSAATAAQRGQVFTQCARRRYLPDINIYAYYRPDHKKYNTIIPAS